MKHSYSIPPPPPPSFENIRRNYCVALPKAYLLVRVKRSTRRTLFNRSVGIVYMPLASTSLFPKKHFRAAAGWT